MTVGTQLFHVSAHAHTWALRRQPSCSARSRKNPHSVSLRTDGCQEYLLHQNHTVLINLTHKVTELTPQALLLYSEWLVEFEMWLVEERILQLKYPGESSTLSILFFGSYVVRFLDKERRLSIETDSDLLFQGFLAKQKLSTLFSGPGFKIL